MERKKFFTCNGRAVKTYHKGICLKYCAAKIDEYMNILSFVFLFLSQNDFHWFTVNVIIFRYHDFTLASQDLSGWITVIFICSFHIY